MLLRLDPSLFETDEFYTDLVGFLQKAIYGRCYLNVVDITSKNYNRWIESLTPGQTAAWANALNLAVRDAAVYRLNVIRVAQTEQSDWASTPPRLSPADATRLVERTKQIWVENGRNDRRFWLAMVGKETRSYLETLLAKGVIEFTGGGGITELRMLVEERIGLEADRRQADWVLFDSDAGSPGRPSLQARDLAEACVIFDIRHFALPRRAIENYLPKDALYAYANARRNRKSVETYHSRLGAFYRMSADQRNHFRMKSGFTSPQEPDEALLFSTVDAEDRRILRHGISRRVADQYHELSSERLERYVFKEGSNRDLLPVIQTIIDSFRVPHG